MQDRRPCTDDCFISTCPKVNPDRIFDPPARHDLPRLDEVSHTIYRPVRSWQTRMLRVLPGKLGEDISTWLRVADVVHAEGLLLHNDRIRVNFSALSYHWGYPVPTQVVKCKEVDVPVIQSLYLILQRIRDPQHDIYLWIDALCINQADVVEKSSSVRGMVTIYKKAQQVFAWMGEYGSCWERLHQYASLERQKIIPKTARVTQIWSCCLH